MIRKHTRRLFKIIMGCSNFIFLSAGFVLMFLGALLFADTERVLLAQLLGEAGEAVEGSGPQQPTIYYVALGIIGIGFVIAITGIIGCCALCLNNCLINSLYITIVLTLLASKSMFCVIIIFRPRLLGLDVRPLGLIRTLQRNYALPGREHFTAAIDLAQTMFSCCGINGSSNYATSWWRLQETRKRDLLVPLTCCRLSNTEDPDAFLNPLPVNATLCQSQIVLEHQQVRHTESCLGLIENWAQEQGLILFGITLSVMLIELSTFLSALLVYPASEKASEPSRSGKSRHRNGHKNSAYNSTQTLSRFSDVNPHYGSNCGLDDSRMSTTTFGPKS